MTQRLQLWGCFFHSFHLESDERWVYVFLILLRITGYLFSNTFLFYLLLGHKNHLLKLSLRIVCIYIYVCAIILMCKFGCTFVLWCTCEGLRMTFGQSSTSNLLWDQTSLVWSLPMPGYLGLDTWRGCLAWRVWRFSWLWFHMTGRIKYAQSLVVKCEFWIFTVRFSLLCGKCSPPMPFSMPRKHHLFIWLKTNYIPSVFIFKVFFGCCAYKFLLTFCFAVSNVSLSLFAKLLNAVYLF